MLSRRAPLLAVAAAALPCAAATDLAAADLAAAGLRGALPGYDAPVRPLSIVSELRVGGAAQDPWSPERGSANVDGEVLFAKPMRLEGWWDYAVPRPTIGGSYNAGGRTSYAYLGATWTIDVTERVFVEGFFGGAAHDGATGPRAFIPPRFNALGCSPLFREAGAVGYRLTEHWSVMATVEHMSNAGLCVENRGLTNVGGKVAYTF